MIDLLTAIEAAIAPKPDKGVSTFRPSWLEQATKVEAAEVYRIVGTDYSTLAQAFRAALRLLELRDGHAVNVSVWELGQAMWRAGRPMYEVSICSTNSFPSLVAARASIAEKWRKELVWEFDARNGAANTIALHSLLDKADRAGAPESIGGA